MLRSPDVVEALIALSDTNKNGIRLPRTNEFVKLPLCRLGELGTCGPVHRLIAGSSVNPNAGAFIVSDHPGGSTDFPILWNHNYENETRFVVPPDKQGHSVLQKEDEASELWKTATKLHFNLDYRFTSQPLAACLTKERTLGGRAWPSFTLHPEEEREEKMEWVYPVLLWANSTLGLMSFYITGTRNQQGRSCLTVSRLPELPVLDPRQLSRSQLADSEDIFNRLKDKEFMPANMADQDPTRRELDEILLCELLGHPPPASSGSSRSNPRAMVQRTSPPLRSSQLDKHIYKGPHDSDYDSSEDAGWEVRILAEKTGVRDLGEIHSIYN